MPQLFARFAITMLLNRVFPPQPCGGEITSCAARSAD
jgi:hypothetical protein